jgi:beta-galactosidase
MKPKLLSAIVVLFMFLSCAEKENHINRELQFNNDWKFFRSDVQNGQAADLDDSGWRTLDLPHDYSIEDVPEKPEVKQIGPFSEESAGGASTGHTVGGTAWYRKHFTLNKEDEGKIIKILFDGVYMNANFWLNGKHLGNHPYGYTAFAYDLTDLLLPAGQENVLAVQVKNKGKNSRWYSGSGIYRNVTLLKTNPVHIDLWGNYITTSDISSEKAVINSETIVVNSLNEASGISVKTLIKNPQGEIVVEEETPLSLSAGEKNTHLSTLQVSNPQLWSDKEPNLYTEVVQLKKGKKVVDQMELKFGIRTIEFSPEKGFLLNGESVLLKGGCMHHDNGPLGSAAFDRAEYRRVRIMKENGFNAIRTAHNPPSKAFLDACDELGMLVLDEAFDQWQRPKNQQDYNLYFDDWWERDLESMILRDRNHPSVIIWSIGNEINERADSSGLEIARKLKGKILSMDKTRPITQAICHFWDHPGWNWDKTAAAFAQMDVHGYNYRWQDYESDHKKYPERIMIGTESFPLEAFENWQMVEKQLYVIGDFVWTGMDYLGESGIGSTRLDNEKNQFLPPWPWFNANCGDVSILGYKKPQMYFRDVVWRNSDLEMMVHAPVPEGRKEVVSMWGWPEEWKSWNWEGNEGKPLQVSVYTRCNEVRLEQNGKIVSTKKVSNETKLTAHFEVSYQPGELTAIGLTDGKEVARQSLKTAGKPFALKITAEHDTITASLNELAYFNVEVVDENGVLVPNAKIPVEFDIQGAGHLQAVANGNPRDMKSFQQPTVDTFRGKCQMIVRSSGSEGEIAVKAVSGILKPATAKVKVVQL